MKISHLDLEVCAMNPQRWYLYAQKAGSHGYKMGYERVLRLAVYRYHKTSAVEARDHLTRMITKHDLRNAARIRDVENGLESYVGWATSVHLTAADVQVRIVLSLGFLELRGEIGRVDVTLTGYRTVLFHKAPPDWQLQLRMPLLQAAIASMYARPIERIEVGFQELDGSNLQTTTYSQREIVAAKRKFRAVGERVRRLTEAKSRG